MILIIILKNKGRPFSRTGKARGYHAHRRPEFLHGSPQRTRPGERRPFACLRRPAGPRPGRGPAPRGQDPGHGGALLVARSSERDQPVRAHHGLPPGEALRLFRLLDSPVARILLCSAKPFLLPDGPQTDGDATAAGGTDVALIVTPLPAEGRPTGALAVRQGRNTSLDQAWVREFLLDTARLLVRLLELDPAAPAPTHDPLVPPAASPPDPAAAPEVPHTLRDLEKSEVIAALRRNGFVQYKAARELGLTMRQMGYRVRKFGLATQIGRASCRERV